MKKYILIILAIISLSFIESDEINWVQKADFGGGKIYDAASFVIGNYAYVATGSNNASYGYGLQKFIYRYDPSSDVWKRMADLPPSGTATFQAVGFAIGGKGYVCGGVKNAALWEYDPATNLWYQRINFPRVIEEGIGFSISSKAYAGLGGASIIDYRNDFYEYDPSKNKWSQLNDFPGAPRRGSIGFSMDGKGYAGLGYKDIGSYNKGYFKDLWEYDPLTDDWTRLPDFPGEARQDAIGFGIDSAIYVGMGGINDFYKYDLKTKEWSTLNYIPGSYRVGAFSFCIGSSIFYGGGMSPNLSSDLWKYSTVVPLFITVNKKDVIIKSPEGSFATAEVTSNTTWVASSDQSWLTINSNIESNGNGSLLFTATKNPTNNIRTAKVTISANGAVSQIISVTQEAGAITSLADFSIEKVKLYPNPAISYFCVDGINESAAKLVLSDLNGKVLFSSNIVEHENISVNSLPKGLYLATIITTNGKIERKLVKE